MKVESQNASIQLSAYLKKVDGPLTQSAIQDRSSEAKLVILDRVNLSQQAQEVQQARQMLAQMPEVRTAKVNQIRASVMEGTYKVPAMTVAEDMVRESFENELVLRKIDMLA